MSTRKGEGVESIFETVQDTSSGCPMHAMHTPRTWVAANDELVFPNHKRVTITYTTGTSGYTELHLYYGEKEISFDEPELFAFGEGLAQQSRFTAKTALTWGEGYNWPRVQGLLEELLSAGILQRASVDEDKQSPYGPKLSPLPPAQCYEPRTWFECEAITRELTGRPVELGYLELIIPIYRVAHIALDTEGRQVGEGNVFPAPLRLDVPTEWRTCPYPGSRYQDELPMNVTALRSMNKYWKPMMVALQHIRSVYLRRFPQAQHGWTVGDLQRLSTLVLALPAYLLMREKNRVENGDLHAVLSSMFRITDGVRMTMHRMLFTSNSEPMRPAHAPMTSAEIYAYAERNTVFLSDHGVCAGSKSMIVEFLNAFVDGKPIEGAETIELDAPIQAALADLEPAFDYGLHALQAYAVVFSLWPTMSRTYEQLLALIEAWPGEASDLFKSFRERLRQIVRFHRTSTRLGTEVQRVSHERVFADMYTKCAIMPGSPSLDATLSASMTPAIEAWDAKDRLRDVLRRRFCEVAHPESPDLEPIVTVLMDYVHREQAIVRTACQIQERINCLLGRTTPMRPLTATDLAVHYRLVALHYRPEELQGIGGRLPYLIDDLEESLGLNIVVSSDHIQILDRAAV